MKKHLIICLSVLLISGCSSSPGLDSKSYDSLRKHYLYPSIFLTENFTVDGNECLKFDNGIFQIGTRSIYKFDKKTLNDTTYDIDAVSFQYDNSSRSWKSGTAQVNLKKFYSDYLFDLDRLPSDFSRLKFEEDASNYTTSFIYKASPASIKFKVNSGNISYYEVSTKDYVVAYEFSDYGKTKIELPLGL